jgi:PhzF family phenazine biosynthesis protein
VGWHGTVATALTNYQYRQVDVFTTRVGFGNPVAVVLGADGLDTATMQQLANWTNLSETTFMLRPTTPEADYRLRIFTPAHELPFAGHPTVGSAHAALEAGIVRGPEFVQECGAGLLPLRVVDTEAGRQISVLAPEARFVRDLPELAPAISACLGATIAADPPPAALSNGPVWLFVRLATEREVAALAPDMAALARFSREQDVTGVAAFALVDGRDVRVHIRCFAPAGGVYEDPVTGSANAALPAYLAHAGQLALLGREYVVTQGTELSRDGRVFVRIVNDQGRAAIGGHAVSAVVGELRL